MALPAVSICIPTYNYAHYLTDAVRSACEQTHPDLEVLIIDDASTDGTAALMERLSRKDPRVRCVHNPRNLGLQANFNRCVELAAHECVKILCADDVLRPTCVEQMARVMASRPEVSLVACAREFVDPDLRPRRSASYAGESVLEPGERAIRRCFFRGNLIGEPSAVMFRKSLAGGGFNESYKQTLDMELWFRLLERGWFAFIPERLCRFRQHRGRATFKHMDTGMIAADRVRLFREFARKPYMGRALGDRILWDLRMAWLLGREPATARDPGATGAHEAVYFPRLLSPLVRAARVAVALGTVPRPS
jgi:glycosyltransferase involved in cell wall biosynthesis